MLEDWRFRESPYVEQGGLVAYAGIPLRMQHESGECISFGTICVASATSQPPLSRQQQQTLTRLADWVVADIVQCTRLRRQRERRRLAELLANAENACDENDSQETVLEMLQMAYPSDMISIQASSDLEPCDLNGKNTPFPPNLENGLWEDTAYIDEVIAVSNHDCTPTDKVVRLMSAQCDSKLGNSLIVVATKNFRRIFDDVDSWFIQRCANLITRIWQRSVMSEALRAKEIFLRGISHQLRTPIHGILGAAELLSEDFKAIAFSDNSSARPASMEVTNLPDIAGKASLYLDAISGAGRELMSTVNSMITLNRWADVAVAERHYASYDVGDLESDLLRRVSETTMHRTDQGASIFFHCDSSLDSIKLRTDIKLLRESLLPVILNALQSTAEGVVAVTFSTPPGTKTLVVDIEDTGCGIHPDDQARIFQLYEKVDEHSAGVGLGLTLSVKFAVLLHGSIELISSRVNQGSHFRATFKNIAHICSVGPPRAIASSFQHLSLKYRQLETDFCDSHLSSNFAKFLARNGFISSKTSAEDCFTISEYSHNSDQPHSNPVSILEQVAIVLVPRNVDMDCLVKIPNVIYASEPFSTSNLCSTLQEADRLSAVLQLTRTSLAKTATTYQSQHSFHDDFLPSIAVCTNLHGGYNSTDESSSCSEDSLQTRELSSGLASDGDSSPTDESSEASFLKRPLAPLPPQKSAKPLVLLVDDNVVNLRILEMYCKKRGLSFVSATDGKAAVELFSKHQALSTRSGSVPIELILMDLQMPICDGINATQQIRSLEEQNSWIPSVVFIVTGQDSQLDKEAASAAGADDYMVKPVGMRHLDAVMKRYFQLL